MRDVPGVPERSDRPEGSGRSGGSLQPALGRLPWEIEAPFGGEGAGADAGADAGAGAGAGGEAVGGGAAPAPTARSRLRIGVGAAVVLVIVALVCAVLVSMFAGRGRVDVVALPTGGAGVSSGASGDPGVATPSAGAGASSAATRAARGPTVGGATTAPDGGAAAPPLLVHVLGAVAHPGLYELHPGDRVIDAVSAAGGFTPTADQGQQNLARVLADGEQLVVPEQGASPPLGSAGSGTSGSGASGSGTSTGGGGGGAAGSPGGVPAPLVNVNTADQATLETLPHVGPAMAQRIIAWRTENGRFTQVDDLKNVSGIGEKTFEALAPLVTT